MEASEVWIDTGQSVSHDYQRDQVSFDHGIALEVETSHNGSPLKASALRRQQKAAQKLEAAILAATSAAAFDGSPAEGLLNLDGKIWTLSRFESQFEWWAQPGPWLDGRRTALLHFAPAPWVHPRSRIEEMLHHTAGVVMVDPATGQVLSGQFASQGAVNFGGGLLAHISSFSGTFHLQRLPGLRPATRPVAAGGPDAGNGTQFAAPSCWAADRIVVHAAGRELFRDFDGTETITYRLVSPHS